MHRRIIVGSICEGRVALPAASRASSTCYRSRMRGTEPPARPNSLIAMAGNTAGICTARRCGPRHENCSLLRVIVIRGRSQNNLYVT
jgi:hypothetical protein